MDYYINRVYVPEVQSDIQQTIRLRFSLGEQNERANAGRVGRTFLVSQNEIFRLERGQGKKVTTIAKNPVDAQFTEIYL